MKNTLLSHNKYLLLIPLALSIILITASSGCFEGKEALKVSLGRTEAIGDQVANERTIHIGVFAMASPKTTMEYYQGFLDHLSDDIGLEVELVQRDNPAEINYLLETGYLDAVLVREDDYLEGHDDFGMEVIAVPVIHGDIHYSSYVVTRSDNNIGSLEDLRGKRFAFNSYRFNRGDIVPEYMRSEINGSPDQFFSSYIYSNSQDNFIDMIMQGTLDGAEIDCIMWAYYVERSVELSSNMKIIYTSPSQVSPAFAVHPDIDPGLKSKIRESLLNMHNTDEGRLVLEDMHFNMFVEMDHDTYSSYGDGL